VNEAVPLPFVLGPRDSAARRQLASDGRLMAPRMTIIGRALANSIGRLLLKHFLVSARIGTAGMR
jgi:hypothetical protein